MTSSEARPPTILIVTASMGGGHDGASNELKRRAQAAGNRAVIFDLLGGMRFGYGHFVTAFYHAQLRYAAWSYEAVYELWRKRPALVDAANGTNTRMARRELLRAIDRFRPVAVVSTYNMASQVLGELTRTGEISVPTFTFITDFGYHPYWTHEATVGYFCVHQTTADAVRGATHKPVVTTGPFVAPAFTPERARRARTRSSLGIGADEVVPLVVAGAWGVGDIDATTVDLGAIGGCCPVVVCGNNAKLAARLRHLLGDSARILGFVDDMADLMEAADLLVENAGGLTSMEAFAAELPVVTYRPIPAHGMDNAHAMARAGVSRYATDRSELAALVDELARPGQMRQNLVDAGRRLFHPDAMTTMLEALDPSGKNLCHSEPRKATTG